MAALTDDGLADQPAPMTTDPIDEFYVEQTKLLFKYTGAYLPAGTNPQTTDLPDLRRAMIPILNADWFDPDDRADFFQDYLRLYREHYGDHPANHTPRLGCPGDISQ